ncbi:MAG: hypothetical protein JWO22_865 [Frankiales bacterium]|nr:hypothetical protein [Frankiales bacterium]
MARVVAHSRNTALPFALGTAGHDVVLVDVDADVRWAEYTAFAEVVVLEIDDPVVCLAIVDGISVSAQTADHDVRILLIAGDGATWSTVEPHPGVAVLHLPLTMPGLHQAIDRLLAGPSLPSVAPHKVIDVRDRASVPAGPSAVAPRGKGQGLTFRGEDLHARGRRVVAPIPDAPRPEPPAPRTISLVRTLTAALQDVSSVAETAAVVLAEALNLLPSSGAAVLVRDGVAWRVAAGVGLRSREDRLTLSPQHWLVSESTRSFGLILTGGEGLWPQLYGVPLSWRKNLLALQLPPAAALLVMAHDDHEYVDSDLQSLLGFADEAGHLLCDARDVRKLARLLEPFCDYPS